MIAFGQKRNSRAKRQPLLPSAFLTAILLVAGFVFSLAVRGASSVVDGYAYVFTNDSRFIKVDLENSRIVDVGAIGAWGYDEIHAVINDPSRQQVFLLVSKLPGRATFNQPTSTQILVMNKEGRFLQVIDDAKPGDAVFGLMSSDGTILAESLNNFEQKKRTTIIRNLASGEIRRKDGFILLVYSTFSENGKFVYTQSEGAPRSIDALNIKDLAVQKRSFKQIGSAEYYSKGILASYGSLFLMVENRTDPKIKLDRRYFIYDVASQKILSQFHTDIRGDIRILEKNKLAVLEDRHRNAGKTRKLLLYRTDSDKLVGSIDVPIKGKIAGISSDRKVIYYLSPNRLSLIDVGSLKMLREIYIPFLDGFLAVVD
jgi:hypothetical protein